MDVMMMGLALFLGVHSTRMVDGWRTAMIGRLGEISWKALFALLSIAGFGLVVGLRPGAAATARVVVAAVFHAPCGVGADAVCPHVAGGRLCAAQCHHGSAASPDGAGRHGLGAGACAAFWQLFALVCLELSRRPKT